MKELREPISNYYGSIEEGWAVGLSPVPQNGMRRDPAFAWTYAMRGRVLDDANVKFASSGGRAHRDWRDGGGGCRGWSVGVFVLKNFHNRSWSSEER